MKCTALLFAMLFLSMSVFAQTKLSYTDADKNYSFDYINTWKINSEAFGKTKMLKIEAPKADSAKRSEAFVGISKEVLPAGVKTLDDAIKAQTAGLKKALGIAKFIENKKLRDKHVLIYQARARDKVLKTKTYVWVSKGYMYTVSYATELKNFDTYLKDADLILNSFRLK